MNSLKSYYVSLTLIPILNDDGSIVFHTFQNDGLISIILKNQNDNYTCYISTAKMMQCKYHI